MSIGVLLGVPGKLKTLLDRWSATVATEAHSAFSYASDLHTTRLTSARAALIDDIAAQKNWKTEEFTSNGTWTRPTGVEIVRVVLVGGGGGGGGGTTTNPGGGGGGGQTRTAWLPVSSSSYSVTIGAGGAGGAGVDGSDGASSTFGSLLTALGGEGGQAEDVTTLARGGGMWSGSAGVWYAYEQYRTGSAGGSWGGRGAPGGQVYPLNVGYPASGFGKGGTQAGGTSTGGGGGGSFGAGGGGGANNTNGTSASANTGGGGGGAGKAASGTKTGGDGGSGYCLVMWME